MLTRKQLDLLQFISKRVQRDGVPPSFDEMKEALDLRSKSGIHRLITALEERGFIRRLPHRARAIEILRMPDGSGGPAAGAGATIAPGAQPTAQMTPPRPEPVRAAQIDALELPVMGRIAAGTPIEAIQHASHSVAVPSAMLTPQGHHFALEVKGDSMIDAGIHDGDVVVIHEQTVAQSGDIIVALVEKQEATLKRLRRQGNAIMLEAANPDFENRVYSEDQVQIQGRMVGLIRTY